MATINCNEISQVALELQMKFANCTTLNADDLDRLVDLITAIGDCITAGTYNQNNIIDRIELSPAVDVGTQTIADRVNALPLFTINEDRIFIFSALETDTANGVTDPVTSLYIFKPGKGVYGDGSTTTLVDTDFIFINEGNTLVADVISIINSNLKSVGTGTNIYGGLDVADDKHKIKSIKSNNLNISEDGEDITIDADDIISDMNSNIANIGGEDEIYKGYNGTTEKHEFRTVKVDPTGIPVAKVDTLNDVVQVRSVTSAGGTVTITNVGETINIETSGGGVGTVDPYGDSTLAWAFNATFDYDTISVSDTINLVTASYHNLGTWTCIAKDAGNTYIDFESNALGFNLPTNMELGMNASLGVVSAATINMTRVNGVNADKVVVRVYRANGGTLAGLTGIEMNVVVRGFNIPAPSTAFITTWTTTGSLQQIELPYLDYGSYSGTIDWGDGSTSPNTYAGRFHTYANPGTYTVTINGTIEGWNFGRTVGGSVISLSNKARISSVEQWGTLKLQIPIFPAGDDENYFADCSNLTLPATDSLDLANLISIQGIFASCLSLITAPGLGGWDTSAIQNMNGIFQGASQFNEPSVNSWNTAAVTTMNSSFRDALDFNQLIDGWDYSSVGDMNNFMTGKDAANYSTANYDALLTRLDALTLQNGVTLDMGTIDYTATGAVGRANVIADHSWTINDGNLV